MSAQVVLVGASQLSDARWFSWAPHTAQVRYAIDARVNGAPLDADAVERRYGVPAEGWEAHAIRNVRDIIVQYARTYGRDEQVTVTLRYSVNGRPIETWSHQAKPRS